MIQLYGPIVLLSLFMFVSGCGEDSESEGQEKAEETPDGKEVEIPASKEAAGSCLTGCSIPPVADFRFSGREVELVEPECRVGNLGYTEVGSGYRLFYTRLCNATGSVWFVDFDAAWNRISNPRSLSGTCMTASLFSVKSNGLETLVGLSCKTTQSSVSTVVIRAVSDEGEIGGLVEVSPCSDSEACGLDVAWNPEARLWGAVVSGSRFQPSLFSRFSPSGVRVGGETAVADKLISLRSDGGAWVSTSGTTCHRFSATGVKLCATPFPSSLLQGVVEQIASGLFSFNAGGAVQIASLDASTCSFLPQFPQQNHAFAPGEYGTSFAAIRSSNGLLLTPYLTVTRQTADVYSRRLFLDVNSSTSGQILSTIPLATGAVAQFMLFERKGEAFGLGVVDGKFRHFSALVPKE